MIFEIFGIAGVIAIVLAFFSIQAGKLIADDLVYILLNIFGALGILISLWNNFNFSAALMELSWLFISLYGLGRFVYLRHKNGTSG